MGEAACGARRMTATLSRGDVVRVVSMPPSCRALPREVKNVFKALVGKTMRVDEVDARTGCLALNVHVAEQFRGLLDGLEAKFFPPRNQPRDERGEQAVAILEQAAKTKAQTAACEFPALIDNATVT